MKTRLVLLAHGETEATRRASFPDDRGPDDDPGDRGLHDRGLNARGREAARERAPALGRRDRVLTSPALAARQTAAILDAGAVVDEALRDLDVGAWKGRALADIVAADPAAAGWITDPGFDAHGGESVERLVARMARWLPTCHARRGTTLAVTHAAVLRATLVALLGAPPSAFRLIDARPLSALTLTSDGRRWAVRGLA